MSDEEQDVRELAYDLWDQAGRPEGEADHFWFAAKRKLAEPGAQSEVAIPPMTAGEGPPIVAAPQALSGERRAEPDADDRPAPKIRRPARGAR